MIDHSFIFIIFVLRFIKVGPKVENVLEVESPNNFSAKLSRVWHSDHMESLHK